jgi:hypothetical protein
MGKEATVKDPTECPINCMGRWNANQIKQMYLLSIFNKKVIGWGDLMFQVCFCHACLRFKVVHIAENMQQRPLGSHFSLGRRIRCNTGVAIATSDAKSNGNSVQVLLAP